MATPQQDDVRRPERSLGDAIVALAETPDDAADVDEQLSAIARLAAERVAAADYASITRLRGEEYVIVAATGDIAATVDQAQFDDRAGPCLQALHTGAPVGVPSTAVTLNWPAFHRTAPRLGLRATVSIPLFTASGAPVAALNLYGRDSAAMAPLIAGVADLYATRGELEFRPSRPPVTEAGAQELLDGYAQALAVRATIRLAITLLADGTYASLCRRAADAGVSLSTAAAAVLRERL